LIPRNKLYLKIEDNCVLNYQDTIPTNFTKDKLKFLSRNKATYRQILQLKFNSSARCGMKRSVV